MFGYRGAQVSYSDTTIQQLLEVTRSGKNTSNKVQLAMAYLEAENVMAVRQLICHWFDLLESGAAADRYPDPKWTAPRGRPELTPALADLVISEMEADFDLEKARFPDSDPNAGPGFYRLLPHARLAFCQELYGLLKSESDLEQEAEQRLKRGESLPPV